MRAIRLSPDGPPTGPRSWELALRAGCVLAWWASAAAQLPADEPAEDPIDQIQRVLNDQSLQLDQQRQMLEQQRIELQSLRSLTPTQSTPPASPITSGYDNGFFIRSQPQPGAADEIPFLMKINSRSQFRHTVFDSTGPNANQNDIEFERLRLAFSGHAGSKDLTYFFQLDGDSDQSETVDMLDYYATFDLADALELDRRHIRVRAGKWKMPFNRSRAESGFKMQFADRSIASVFFDINRSLGAGLIVRDEWSGRPWQAEIAIHNGFKTGAFQPVRAEQLDQNMAVSGRWFVDLVGSWGKDGEVDLAVHKTPAVRVGAGFAATRVSRSGFREFSRQRVVDSGVTLESLLPSAVTRYGIAFYAVDANLKWRGLTVLTEYYFRQMNDFAGSGVGVLNDHGFMVQAGYFLIPGHWDMAARWSRIVGDSGSLGAFNASVDEVAGGTTWYIRGQKLKLQFDVTHLTGSPLTDRALNVLPGDRGLMYRTQLQLVF